MNRNRPLRVHSSQLGVFGLPAAGLVSEFDKINILTSEDSSRLGVGVYALLLRVLTCRGELQIISLRHLFPALLD